MDELFHASSVYRSLYDEISAFTVTLGNVNFIHQLAVDSYSAKHSGPDTKPISTAFA